MHAFCVQGLPTRKDSSAGFVPRNCPFWYSSSGNCCAHADYSCRYYPIPLQGNYSSCLFTPSFQTPTRLTSQVTTYRGERQVSVQGQHNVLRYIVPGRGCAIYFANNAGIVTVKCTTARTAKSRDTNAASR